MDGSIDKGNVEDELFVIVYSTKDTVAEEIGTHARLSLYNIPKG